MTSRTNGGIRWTRHKKIEEFLDDPLVEEIYGLFLQVKDSTDEAENGRRPQSFRLYRENTV